MVVVGGSAGSLEPLRELTAALPADLPGPVLVTVHVGEGARSELPWLLCRSGRLPAGHAREGERPGSLVAQGIASRSAAGPCGPGFGDARPDGPSLPGAGRACSEGRLDGSPGTVR